MDTKDDKYNFDNIPEKHWDELPVTVKQNIDKDIDRKLKGDVKVQNDVRSEIEKRSDIA